MFKFVNNWKYKGWNNSKFLFLTGINVFGRRFFVIIVFGLGIVLRG